MSNLRIVAIILILTASWNFGFGQSRRADSTLKVGKVGYRYSCSNKSDDINEVDIRPIGFDGSAQASRLNIKGRVTGSAIDDLNNDGFPDLVLFTKGGVNAAFGDVYAIISIGNKSMMPAGLPDVQLDGKNREGYRGFDDFSLMEGTVLRKFPIYKQEDSLTATGGKRILQYRLEGNDEKGFKFIIVQSFVVK